MGEARRLGVGCKLSLALAVALTATFAAVAVWAIHAKRIDDKKKLVSTLKTLERCAWTVRTFNKASTTGPLIVPEGDLDEFFGRDAWGRLLHYACPGPLHKNGFDVISAGANGIYEDAGGDDLAVGEDVPGGLAAIHSWSVAAVTTAPAPAPRDPAGAHVETDTERVPSIVLSHLGYEVAESGPRSRLTTHPSYREKPDEVHIVAVIPGWRRTFINAHTFTVRFKPALDPSGVTSRQVLLAWESGEPRQADFATPTMVIRESPGGPGHYPRGEPQPIVWGAKACCTIWLEPSTNEPAKRWTLKARIRLEPNPGTEHYPARETEENGTPKRVPAEAFDVTFATAIDAGSRHSASLAFRAQLPSGAPATERRHVRFLCDDAEVTSSHGRNPDADNPRGDDWPQQADVRARVEADALWFYSWEIGTTHFQLCDKRRELVYPEDPVYGKCHPVQLVPGALPIQVGRGIGPDAVNVFRGEIELIGK